MKPWKHITRLVPSRWIGWHIVNSTGWRHDWAFRVYCWFETRRVHEELIAEYTAAGLWPPPEDQS